MRFTGSKLLITMGITAALVLGTTACTKESSDTATVVSITDGDTLVASMNGKDHVIRLLNIDTPETKDPSKAVECLGAEATEFLRDLLPVGAKITLEYDVERTDKYNRTLAAVFTSSDAFVSAEIARAGLGTAVVFGKNSKFLPPVQEAAKEAKANSQGIYNPDVACTLPAQLASATAALETVVAAKEGSTAAATGALITAAELSIATAKTLKALVQTGTSSADMLWQAAFDAPERETHVKAISTKIQDAESQLASLEHSEASQAKAEAAAVKAAAVKAEAEAAAQAAAAEAERIRNQPPVYVPPAPAPYVPPVYEPPAYEPPAVNSGGGYPGYNGPRCYAPGGKTWRPC